MATTDKNGVLTGQEHLTAPERLALEEELTGTPPLVQTPSQTIGPFYGFALPFDGGAQLVPGTMPGAVRLHGTVYDGQGVPVPDALLELWQPDEQGRIVQEPGSRARQRGRFTGFGRAAVEVDGSYEFVTLLPGALGEGEARFAALAVFGRGLSHHLFTRAYFVAAGEQVALDALLTGLPEDRRSTLLARQDGPDSYRFDIRLQGEGETVFLDFPASS
ncbi:MAG: pcaG [Naasia sp.]|jgi:protocatechuate 3,4-dioxygenase alpha subunit|uniref:protocatechuate 3,4-dioxygenase subunit alpha n=1 Tax=Naasia sp. TaxID=2546198 RepID=UPI00261651E5|nr:protocatechuate 3,4-dioxygenase subunit alpha [Naasia sp.]MCU1571438.1 pcaG [Naasia sp.]